VNCKAAMLGRCETADLQLLCLLTLKTLNMLRTQHVNNQPKQQQSCKAQTQRNYQEAASLSASTVKTLNVLIKTLNANHFANGSNGFGSRVRRLALILLKTPLGSEKNR